MNIFPKKESFFAWAVTDNGSTFNWFITDDNPNLWKTVILGSDPSEMEFFDMGCVEFLYSILIGKIKSTLMPDNFAISFSHSIREIS
ncbi:hypothetical protein [Conchiformibius steedae]|uniref:Uncharacterized protein n=1 Tax=Conchiformibius steedae TaxID=153493 RepID=A0A3P2A8B9_9NEIS|nr:hypothetical protein [Conchiformibius steedae]RRD90520.1 hypothetical protein EII21_04370 [Conchiformibius steedae]